VQALLASLLPKGPPHRDDVAAQMMMSERTLQRRLAEEGTSFTNLVDDTRRELARQSLSAGELSLKMLSFQLGFSEPSAFYRACKRWFGMAPSDIQHLAHQPGPGPDAASAVASRVKPHKENWMGWLSSNKINRCWVSCWSSRS
jgi:AraC-like DNA-binding protein